MRYTLSSMLVGTLLLGLGASSAMADAPSSAFEDVDPGAYYSPAVKDLVTRGIVHGIDSSHFAPSQSITRAEFATMIALTLGLNPIAPAVPTFSDVSQGSWAYGTVEAAVQTGFIHGTGQGLFQPNATVTREQAATMLVLAFKQRTNSRADSQTPATNNLGDTDGWAATYVEQAESLGLVPMEGNSSFNGMMALSRADAAVWDDHLLKILDSGRNSSGPGSLGNGGSTGSSGSSGTVNPSAAGVSVVFPTRNIELQVGTESAVVLLQVQDAAGKPIKAPGVPIEVTLTRTHGDDSATLAPQAFFGSGGSSDRPGNEGPGTTAPTQTVNVYTNAAGQAALSFSGTVKAGDEWSLMATSASGVSLNDSPVTISVPASDSTAVNVLMYDNYPQLGGNGTYPGNRSFAQAGDTVTVIARVFDANGYINMNGDSLRLVIPSGLANLQGIDGTTLVPTDTPGTYEVKLAAEGAYPGEAVFTARAVSSGVQSLEAEDVSPAAGSAVGDASITVLPGPVAGSALFTLSGQAVAQSNPLSLQGGESVQLWLRPVDAYGNPAQEGQTEQYVTLTDHNGGGVFELSPSGPAVNTVTIPIGMLSVPVYYVNPKFGSYVLTAETPSLQ